MSEDRCYDICYHPAGFSIQPHLLYRTRPVSSVDMMAARARARAGARGTTLVRRNAQGGQKPKHGQEATLGGARGCAHGSRHARGLVVSHISHKRRLEIWPQVGLQSSRFEEKRGFQVEFRRANRIRGSRVGLDEPGQTGPDPPKSASLIRARSTVFPRTPRAHVGPHIPDGRRGPSWGLREEEQHLVRRCLQSTGSDAVHERDLVPRQHAVAVLVGLVEQVVEPCVVAVEAPIAVEV